MAEKSKQNAQQDCLLPVEDLPMQSGKVFSVDYSPEAPKGSPNKEIHSRQPLPPLPKGDDVPDLTPSPPVNIGS